MSDKIVIVDDRAALAEQARRLSAARRRRRRARSILAQHQAWRREAQLRVSERDYQVQRGEDGMAWSVQDEARRQAEDAGRRFERQQQQSQHGRVAAARVEGAATARRDATQLINLCRSYGRADLFAQVVGMSFEEAKQHIIGEMWNAGQVAARAQHLPVTVEPPQ